MQLALVRHFAAGRIPRFSDFVPRVAPPANSRSVQFAILAAISARSIAAISRLAKDELSADGVACRDTGRGNLYFGVCSMSAKSSVLSVPQIVAQYSASVIDAPTYVSACTAIDALVNAGQVTMVDASAAKAQLATVMASAIAAKSATSSNKPTYKASPAGCVHFRSVPGASVQYGLSLFPETLNWLFANQAAIASFVADGVKAGTLSTGSAADRAKFGAAKDAAKAAWEAKQAAK